MFQGIQKFFSKLTAKNKKLLKPILPLVKRINDLEPSMRGKTDEELIAQTKIFQERFQRGETLDQLLPEAFATVREASRRVLGMRHFDVQLMGGIALHKGMIAEMKTGEGKTLVATAPVYLNAIAGKGVHVVTVNDYLAKRDSQHMGKLYEFLGMTVGCIVQDLDHHERKVAYGADITYGTNNELGFDYLRDNMKYSVERMCQRPFYFAIVDEVDSILIDEARTPLIISGPVEDTESLYEQADEVILELQPQHYEKDEKHKSVAFTDEGYGFVEDICRQEGIMQGNDLFQPINVMLVHHLNQALKAHKAFQKDVDYIVKDNKVMIIDEFTGRIMKGRRYSDGLHQALEAKEHVEIELENQTVASITFQNYFRMYPKLSGMTGTGATEASEFQEIYNLPVLVVPTNTPIGRKDHDDEIFRTFDQKLRAIVQQVRECHKRQQPVLVGTASIEKSEIFARAFMREGLPFHVLNARHHEKEAQIIAQAGMPGAITIATNMAGRGTDIKLGGNLDVRLQDALENITDETMIENITYKTRDALKKDEELARQAGGLYVLGTERHESRRIDNQLRGRSGRQGDPGESKFFISLEDDLMRIFGPNLAIMDRSLASSETKKNQKLGHDGKGIALSESADRSEAIQHPWLTRAIEKAQKRVEAQHFETRKHLLKYANVLNDQRQAVYTERYKLMSAEDIQFEPLALHILDTLIETYKERGGNSHNGSLAIMELEGSLKRIFNIDISLEDLLQRQSMDIDTIKKSMAINILQDLKYIVEELGPENLRKIVKTQYLKMLDNSWTSHLNTLEHLRESIYLQAYGQKDPLNEYKRESFLMFQGMIDHWHQNFLAFLFHIDPEDYVHNDGDYDHDDEDEDGGSMELSLGNLMRLLEESKKAKGNQKEEEWDDEDEDEDYDDDEDDEDDDEDEDDEDEYEYVDQEENEKHDPRVSPMSVEEMERKRKEMEEQKVSLENAMAQLLAQLKQEQEEAKNEDVSPGDMSLQKEEKSYNPSKRAENNVHNDSRYNEEEQDDAGNHESNWMVSPQSDNVLSNDWLKDFATTMKEIPGRKKEYESKEKEEEQLPTPKNNEEGKEKIKKTKETKKKIEKILPENHPEEAPKKKPATKPKKSNENQQDKGEKILDILHDSLGGEKEKKTIKTKKTPEAQKKDDDMIAQGKKKPQQGAGENKAKTGKKEIIVNNEKAHKATEVKKDSKKVVDKKAVEKIEKNKDGELKNKTQKKKPVETIEKDKELKSKAQKTKTVAPKKKPS